MVSMLLFVNSFSGVACRCLPLLSLLVILVWLCVLLWTFCKIAEALCDLFVTLSSVLVAHTLITHTHTHTHTHTQSNKKPKQPKIQQQQRLVCNVCVSWPSAPQHPKACHPQCGTFTTRLAPLSLTWCHAPNHTHQLVLTHPDHRLG